MRKLTTPTPTKTVLPEGILTSDLKYPEFSANCKTREWESKRPIATFEIWRTERFGWCIPTLTIRNTSRTDRVRRTYATSIDSGSTVRIGLGPHVKEHFTVYVTKATQSRLQKFVDLQDTGAGKANDIRDTISSRRLRSASRGLLSGWGF